MEGEGDERLVTFLWRGGDETRNVLVVASPSDLASEYKAVTGSATSAWMVAYEPGADPTAGDFLSFASGRPFVFAENWDNRPILTREAFRVRSKSPDLETARAKAAELTLVGRAERIRCPLLAVLGQLGATRNWYRIGREWWFGEPPATELGELEAAWAPEAGRTRR